MSRVARSVRRLLAAAPLLLIGLLLFGPAAPAAAHAYLTASNPADGSTLTRAPATLQLRFSESVDLPATQLDIVDGNGRHHRPTHLRLDRGDDTEEPSAVTADLPALGRGVYRISWSTLSSDDLHRTSGVLSFGIGVAAAPTSFVEPLPRPEETVLRWALFGCLAAACGGLLAVGLARPGPAGGTVVVRARRLAVGGAGLGLLVAGALLVDQAERSGVALPHLLGAAYGRHWLLREAGLALLLAAAAGAAGRRRRVLGGLAVVGAAATGYGAALLGHAAAAADSGPTRLTADAVHLIAAATWVGTVAVFALVASSGAAAALRRFAGPAAVCVGVLAVTGLYLASGVVGSVDAALLTWYGRVLLLKVGLFGALGLVGLVNHRRLRSRPPGRWRRTVIAEAVLGGLVLGLAAFLTSAQPAREPRFVSAPGQRTVPFVDGRVADLQERVSVSPNRPGRAVVVVDVLDTRRPAPAPIDRVLVRVLGPGSEDAAPVAAVPLAIHGRWSAAVDVAAAGRARVEVTVDRPGMPRVRHAFAWSVAELRPPVRPATVSTAPLGGRLRVLAGFAAGVVALLLGIAGARLLGRRSTGRTDPRPGSFDSPHFPDGSPGPAGSLDWSEPAGPLELGLPLADLRHQ